MLTIRTEKEKWSDFKERILPHLEALLRFSLRLTVNGRDAVDLLRESLTEAYQSWTTMSTGESCRSHLQDIMTRRSFGGGRRRVHRLVPAPDDGESFVAGKRLVPGTAGDSRRKSSPASDTESDTEYSDAIAGLPEVFRLAMILSYLEGFSNTEIAGLAGVPPHAIDTLLERGREIIREELFSYLMDNGWEETDSVGAAGEGGKDRL